MSEKTALFAGSFDPFTRGHEALVEEALRLFDQLVIGVGENIRKQGLLSVENRCRLIRDLYAQHPNVKVLPYRGLTYEFARQIGATALIRGVRNALDFEYERTLEMTNRRLAPDLVTVVLMTPPEVCDIASSTIRELLLFGQDVSTLIPAGIDLKNYINKN